MSTAPNYDFNKFKHLVHDVTQDFKRISNSIISIEKKLRLTKDTVILADLVNQLQDSEKTKLELTAKLQLAKQETFENPDDESKWSSISKIKEK